MTNNSFLIEDINIGKEFQLLGEQTEAHKEVVGKNGVKGILKLGGVFQEAEEINRNGRIYSRSLLESVLNRDLVPMVKTKDLLGELDHNEDYPEMSRVSHAITDLYMDGVYVKGELVILPTQHGRDAAVIYKAGVQPHISARGLGSVSVREDGTQIVQEDYKLLTYDLVSIASHKNASPTILEKSFPRINNEKDYKLYNVLKYLLENDFDSALKIDRKKTLELGEYVEFLNEIIGLSEVITDIKRRKK